MNLFYIILNRLRWPLVKYFSALFIMYFLYVIFDKYTPCSELFFDWLNLSDSNYLSLIIELLPGIYAIAMPLFMEQMFEEFKGYKDSTVLEIIFDFPAVEYMLFHLPIYLIVLVIMLFLGLDKGILAIFILISIIIIILRFIHFMVFLSHFKMNADEMIFDESVKRAKNELTE